MTQTISRISSEGSVPAPAWERPPWPILPVSQRFRPAMGVSSPKAPGTPSALSGLASGKRVADYGINLPHGASPILGIPRVKLRVKRMK
jgi:hypothetical protein